MAIFGEAVIWAFFPIITILSYQSLPPILSLAYSSIFAVLFFGAIIIFRKKTKEIFHPKVWLYIPVIAFFITILFYGFFFTGLQYTTAGNASIIALMELFFSYLFFNIWKKEYFSVGHTLGAALMLVGALIILFPKHGLNFNRGDILILLAVACPPVGNYYQQKLRKFVSSETILFLRSLVAIPVFFILAAILKAGADFNGFVKSFWFLAINGILLLGLSKIFWMEGIHRISVTKANALASVAPLFTLIFSYWILKEQPQIWQLLALVPIGFGVGLLTGGNKKS